jgi:probable lipoprotein NlpC
MRRVPLGTGYIAALRTRAPLATALMIACASQQHATVEEIAAGWIGTPYRAGGTSKRGTDCSGFVHAVMAEDFGIELPRRSRDQARMGVAVDRSDLRPGDLLFFDLRKGRHGIDHVALYTGDGRFVHASPRRGVAYDRLDQPVYRRSYRGARRVIAKPETR